METEVRKLDSPLGDSQICLENSEWLAENIKGIDQSLKEMLLLIGHDEEFHLEGMKQNHTKQPELIAHIKDIYSRHDKLADYYQKLTGNLTGHVQLNNEMENGEKTGSEQQLHLEFLTPPSKLGMLNFEEKSECSDLSPSLGGGTSDTAPNEDSESSTLLSDSDSESCNSSPYDLSCPLLSDKMGKYDISKDSGMGGVFALPEQAQTDGAIKAEECEMHLKRISHYEMQLRVSEEKCQLAHEEIAKLKSEMQKNESLMVKMDFLEVELVSENNRIRLHEDELEKENKRSMKLQEHIVDLETNFKLEKMRVQDLEENVTKLKAELLNRDLEIQKTKAELEDSSGNFAMEKWQLESSISELSEHVSFLEAREKELQIECESLVAAIKEYETEKIEMEKAEAALSLSRRDDIVRLNKKIAMKHVRVQTLTAKLDRLKVKHDILKVEKDESSTNVQTLSSELSNREEQMKHLEQNLLELQSENKQLIAGSDQSNKLTAELQSRIVMLEKEVASQAVLISDTAEGKREAIRQLCFSLDHFKSSYDELRNMYGLSKKPKPLTSGAPWAGGIRVCV